MLYLQCTRCIETTHERRQQIEPKGIKFKNQISWNGAKETLIELNGGPKDKQKHQLHKENQETGKTVEIKKWKKSNEQR